MQNTDIRLAAAANNVRLWEIAEAYGIADTTFSKLLRRELPHEKKQEILDIINKLSSRTGSRW